MEVESAVFVCVWMKELREIKIKMHVHLWCRWLWNARVHLLVFIVLNTVKMMNSISSNFHCLDSKTYIATAHNIILPLAYCYINNFTVLWASRAHIYLVRFLCVCLCFLVLFISCRLECVHRIISRSVHGLPYFLHSMIIYAFEDSFH